MPLPGGTQVLSSKAEHSSASVSPPNKCPQSQLRHRIEGFGNAPATSSCSRDTGVLRRFIGAMDMNLPIRFDSIRFGLEEIELSTIPVPGQVPSSSGSIWFQFHPVPVPSVSPTTLWYWVELDPAGTGTGAICNRTAAV